MKDNEKEVIDETVEETQEEVNEAKEVETTDVEETEEEDNEDGSPTIEDYQKLKKEAETLKAQKEHWRKKAQTSKPIEKEETKETNNNYLTRDEAILLAKGFDEDDLSKLKKLAGDGNLIEASTDPMFTAYKKEKERKEKSAKAQLNSSTGLLKGQKPISQMSDEEHKALFYKTIGKK